MSVESLVARQNRDGGWAYVRGGSWTEPTVYAVLALTAAGETAAARRGIEWIRGLRRRDGGWAPRRGVEESSWVTGLVAWLPPDAVGAELHEGAVAWLLGKQGRETTRLYRLREWLLGSAAPADQQYAGWPWVPQTAAWVGPTSIAVLALRRELQRRSSDAVAARVREGQEFLLSRTCAGGGWNHGSSQALGYAANAYPETTGMALAALRGVEDERVKQGIGVARAFLQECRSADALNWLRAGLRAHDELPAGYSAPTGLTRHTVSEVALDELWPSIA